MSITVKTKSGWVMVLPNPDGEPDKPNRGRPLGSGKKVQVTLRIDAEVLDSFKSLGAGWQTQINEALKKATKRHRNVRRPPGFV